MRSPRDAREFFADERLEPEILKLLSTKNAPRSK